MWVPSIHTANLIHLPHTLLVLAQLPNCSRFPSQPPVCIRLSLCGRRWAAVGSNVLNTLCQCLVLVKHTPDTRYPVSHNKRYICRTTASNLLDLPEYLVLVKHPPDTHYPVSGVCHTTSATPAMLQRPISLIWLIRGREVVCRGRWDEP